MSRYADPDRCPDCRSALPPRPAPRSACPACGLPLEGERAVELFTTLQRADALVASLRAEADTEQVEPAPMTPAAQTPFPLTPYPVSTPPTSPLHHHPAARRWTVPAVLLSLGALCLVVGALVFLAVTWSVLGVGGRTAVLVGLTLVAAGGAWLSGRRGLRGAAETFATVASLFLALDLAGAANAGWFGSAGATTSLLVASLVVLVVPAAGNAAFGRLPTGVLLAPQLVGSLAAFVAVAATLTRWADHQTSAAVVAVVVSLAFALAVRRTAQPVLAVGVTVVAGLTWLFLVLLGFGQAVDAWSLEGRGAATWSDVAPALAAAGLALVLVVATGVRRTAPLLQGVALVAACWLVPASVAAVVAESVTGIVVVALVAGALATGLAALVGPVRRPAGIAACGLATAGVLGSLSAVGVLVEGVADEVVRQLDATSPDLGAVADLAPYDADVAAPWTLVLGAVVLAGAVAVTLGRSTGATSRRLALAVAAPVVAATVLCYAPALLLVVGAAVALAVLQLVPATRLQPPELAWGAATGWAVVAGAVAVYDPLPATLVALGAAIVAAAVVVRTGSVIAQGSLPPLVALTVACAGWLFDVPGEWTVAAAIVVVGLVATLVGSVPVGGVAALATCLVLVLLGVGEADQAGRAVDQWLAAYLTLTAAGAAAVAVRRRSRPAAWTSAGLAVAATWVRLAGAGVGTPEAYALPLAAVLLVFGGWEWRRDRSLGTMSTLAPGLGVALVPTLVACVGDPVSLRALLLALACAALVTLGAVGRLRAPFVTGALVGAVLVVIEVAPYHDAVPRWVLLTIAGVCLVLAGVRWEYLAGLGRRSWGRLTELD